jgi:hypothetical protein
VQDATRTPKATLTSFTTHHHDRRHVHVRSSVAFFRPGGFHGVSSVCSEQQAQQPNATAAPATVSDALDHAKRAFALRKYEQAVEHYATALELLFVVSLYLPYPT